MTLLSVWLRQQYIVNNPNPIGKKDQLLSGAESSFYNQVHVAYHLAFEQLQKNLQLDDLLLIEANTAACCILVAKADRFPVHGRAGSHLRVQSRPRHPGS